MDQHNPIALHRQKGDFTHPRYKPILLEYFEDALDSVRLFGVLLRAVLVIQHPLVIDVSSPICSLDIHWKGRRATHP